VAGAIVAFVVAEMGASGKTVAADASGLADAVSVGEAGRGPRSSAADADRLESANTMAHAMANFTRVPLHVSAKRLL
jgi:hypothetical protein